MDAPLGRRMIKLIAFVQHLREITQYEESMSESGWDPKLKLLVSGQIHRIRPAKCGLSSAKVNDNILYSPMENSDEFGLRKGRNLIV
jgi:hypothetical protein